ncbi:hypothetical protein Patl1_34666 [Pistacia atlantica]|uniref:Uncharacterized protein n=1 Tax=Pistacia atlantica TaxID=434234 RepID=A0ACC0ZST3_9ROSI|nr:hypothetical protein Patl1_34666 [Pistacia atlantica]
MLSSTVSRCFNPIPLLSRFQVLLFPTSYIHSQTPKPHSNPYSFDQETVHNTLSSYANDWSCAFEFFNWVETDYQFNHTTETCNRMIDILGKFFEFDQSWNLIHRMKQNPLSLPNHATFRIMFKRYVNAHLVNEAVDTFNRLGEFNLRDETSYCNLVDSLCEYKHVIEAQDLCFGENKIVGFNNNNTKIYNMILRGWFKMGWWAKCREFWEEMDKRGVVKDLHSYSIYMDIVCKSGKPWKAVKLFKEVKKKGIEMDVVAWKKLGCSPDEFAYNALIDALIQKGMLDMAKKYDDEMLAKGLSPRPRAELGTKLVKGED